MSRRTRTLIVASLMVLTVGAAVPAYADHDHVLLLGNGQCVVLAADGEEKYVVLPGTDEFPEGRQHPLHVNAHLDEPGTRDGDPVIFVKGSPEDLANCQSYVNP
jgi:hypothetical protein